METPPSKDGKSLPMFTPKNSDGSQRVIKNIMVIDPNKLRVAGLDLKMAEALKKSKGKGSNTNSPRTKDDKLALAKTILNRKLKQVKFSKELQNQNVMPEKCDSAHKLQPGAVALKTLLSSSQTIVAPSPKQPHTMVVSVVQSDQRTGSIELTISDKQLTPENKPVIPKASLKKPEPVKEVTPRVESVVVSPEVKFEVKRKSLQPNIKRVSSGVKCDLPKVIESKVLSQEEKIDMKTLCGTSTKPVPATVKIEITKQEVVQRDTPDQVDILSLQSKPEQYVIVPSPELNIKKNMEKQLSPKSIPQQGEATVTVVKEESAVDFINSLLINTTPKCTPKLKTEPKVEPKRDQEDATSFLMSLFAQQASIPPKETKPLNGIPSVGEIAKRNELNKPQSKETKEMKAQGHRRNLKPVPIMKQKPRLSGTSKVAKNTSVGEFVPADSVSKTPIELELSKGIGAASTESKELRVGLPIVETNVKTKPEIHDCRIEPSVISRDKGDSVNECTIITRELAVSETESTDINLTERENSSEDLSSNIAEISKHEEAKKTTTATVLGGEEFLKDTVSKDARKVIEADDLAAFGVDKISDTFVGKLIGEELEEDSCSKPKPTFVDAEEINKIPVDVTENCSRKVKATDTVVQNTKKTAVLIAEETVAVVAEETAAVAAEDTAAVVADDTAAVVAADTAAVVTEDTTAVIPKETAAVIPEENNERISGSLVVEKLDSVNMCSVEACNEKSASDEVICDSKCRLEVETYKLCKEKLDVDVNPSDLLLNCTKSEAEQPPPVAEKNETVESPPAKETNQPVKQKEEPAPAAPPPIGRRKGKKSVPILIAKLNRSRKTVSSQEKQKEPTKQLMSTGDKTDESSETKKDETTEAGVISTQRLSEGEMQIGEMEDTSKKGGEKIVSKQPTRQELTSQEPLLSNFGAAVTKNPLTLTEIEGPEKKQETSKEYTFPAEIVTSLKSDTPCTEEVREGDIIKNDNVAIELQPVAKVVSLSPSNGIESEQKGVSTEAVSEPTAGKQFTLQNCEKEESVIKLHDLNPTEERKPSERDQKISKTAANVTEETTCIRKDASSINVRHIKDEIIPFSRVRKKSSEFKDNVKNEAVPDVQIKSSLKTKSPKCSLNVNPEPIKNDMNLCEEIKDTSISDENVMQCDLSPFDKFDMIRENLGPKNARSSVEIVKSKGKEGEPNDIADSVFKTSFQEETEIDDDARFDNSSPHDLVIDFDRPCSDDEISVTKVKPLYESKEDLGFLGFNEKEIEEGQQSTSLRLSQSEDVSPLIPPTLSENPTRKKTTPQVKKSPLSAAKKQKAEQKKWKKSSAKSLQNWLKSSDKDPKVKAEEIQKIEESSATGENVVSKEDSTCISKEITLPVQVENNLSSKSNASGKKSKSKQEKGAEKKTKKVQKPEKSPPKNRKTEKNIVDSTEIVSDISCVIHEENTTSQNSTPTPICAEESTTTKSAATGRKRKIKKETPEENVCPTPIEVDTNSVIQATEPNITLDKEVVKIEIESPQIKTPNLQQKRGKRGSLAAKANLTNQKHAEPTLLNISTNLETNDGAPNKNPTDNSTPVPTVPRQKRKYTRRKLITPNASDTTKTPKSSRSQKNALSLSQSIEPQADVNLSMDDMDLSFVTPKSRKRKAPKCETETPIKVAHISADTGAEFATPSPKQREPETKELDIFNTPEPIVTPKSGRKYKDNTEFNPRLLLVRKKGELKSEEPLVDDSLQTVPKSKDDVQCALCMGYTHKKKWLQHVSDHYGVGWVVGTKPPINIYSRSAVLNYMVEFFKSSKVKGLNCRLCRALRRSALGLLTHLEQCCLTVEEIKETRMECEHCRKEYSKSSMVTHVRSCPELYKKNKALNTPKVEIKDDAADQEVALSNTGRLKRKSVIKAENKFKDMDKMETNPDELIRHIPQPRRDRWVESWQRDINSFGRGFCIERKCEFTAETVDELQQHCQPNVCPFFVQPGYVCMKCKFHSDTAESVRQHVTNTHISKATEDFQESDDDAVVESGESSSDDGSSGDEEASQKSFAVQDGSLKRKSKQKARAPRRMPQICSKRPQPLKDIRKLIPLRTEKITLEVSKLYEGFIKSNFSEKPLFCYATTSADQILDEDVEGYFPKSKVSLKFVLKGFKTPFVDRLGKTSVQPDQWQQLERLKGMEAASEHVMFLGGPVKTMAWVPLLPNQSEVQYLATVARKEANKFARFMQPKHSRSLVYIHRYQVSNTDSKMISGEIYYALAIDEGPIHCIEFLPSGGYDPDTNRLGLLAVGTVDSEVKIYSLPLNVHKRECDIFPIIVIEPSFVLALELDKSKNASSEYYSSQCTNLSWSQAAGHSHIVAGYLNGFVSIWDIADEEDNLNRFLVDGVRTFVPVSYFWSKDDRIRALRTHYDADGLRWLLVWNEPRRLVFYDIRDLSKPMQIMEERTKNNCNGIDWPVVWVNPAFALGDAMPTHGNCLNSISPMTLGYITKKFEKFCCGATDIHYNPWTNMYVAGSENGDIHVIPLRDTIFEASFRRKRDEKLLSTLDIVPLNGGDVIESLELEPRLLETDCAKTHGIVFGRIREIIGVNTPGLYSEKRVPPLVLSRLSRVHQVRFNLNQKKNTFLAVGYVNGLVRVLMNKWEDPVD